MIKQQDVKLNIRKESLELRTHDENGDVLYNVQMSGNVLAEIVMWNSHGYAEVYAFVEHICRDGQVDIRTVGMRPFQLTAKALRIFGDLCQIAQYHLGDNS